MRAFDRLTFRESISDDRGEVTVDGFDLLRSLESNACPRIRMGFHLTVPRRASHVEKVIGRAKIELEGQVPILGQFGLCRLDVCSLNVTLRRRPNGTWLRPNLWILSCTHFLVRR